MTDPRYYSTKSTAEKLGVSLRTIQLWVARQGQPSTLVIDFSPQSGHGYDIANNSSTAKYGKIWLLPYHTGKDSTQVTPTAYTWYDELIISRTQIADPK